jgi:hypothetical protein
MRSNDVRATDTSQLVGGGCLISVPILLGIGFKLALNYAKGKEHEFAHQVEEVELEGEAAALLDSGLTPEQAVTRFLKKMERITSQFEKLGGRFSEADFKKETARLEMLRGRAAEEDNPKLRQMLEKAALCLKRFPPHK